MNDLEKVLTALAGEATRTQLIRPPWSRTNSID